MQMKTAQDRTYLGMMSQRPAMATWNWTVYVPSPLSAVLAAETPDPGVQQRAVSTAAAEAVSCASMLCCG